MGLGLVFGLGLGMATLPTAPATEGAVPAAERGGGGGSPG